MRERLGAVSAHERRGGHVPQLRTETGEGAFGLADVWSIALRQTRAVACRVDLMPLRPLERTRARRLAYPPTAACARSESVNSGRHRMHTLVWLHTRDITAIKSIIYCHQTYINYLLCKLLAVALSLASRVVEHE